MKNKKTDNDIFIAQNSWICFLDQSMAASFYINGDYFTVNAVYPGILAPMTDFGYNFTDIFLWKHRERT